MPRSLRTFLPVVGPPESLALAFDGDPQRWLPAARQDGPSRWRMTVHAGTLSRPVWVNVGTPWRAGGTRWRSLSWDAVEPESDPTPIERLLPALDGELGLHFQKGGGATLVLDARYRPPGGALGSAVDTVALSRVARGTVERFLEEISARLAAEALLLAPADGSGVQRPEAARP